jgi:hypothetical protein
LNRNIFIAPGDVAELPDEAAAGIRALVREGEPVAAMTMAVTELAKVEVISLGLAVDVAPVAAEVAPPVAARPPL